MRELRQIFGSFFKIGLFTFGGGYAMIPLVEREIIRDRRWIEPGQFAELLALAQSAPGPISLNTAVFVGYKLRGYPGALAGVVGVALPSFVIMLIIAVFFTGLRDNPYVAAAFAGMRPAVVALIVVPVIGLLRGTGLWAYPVAAAAAFAIWFLGVSPVWLIVAGAGGGIAFVLVRNRKEVRR